MYEPKFFQDYSRNSSLAMCLWYQISREILTTICLLFEDISKLWSLLAFPNFSGYTCEGEKILNFTLLNSFIFLTSTLPTREHMFKVHFHFTIQRALIMELGKRVPHMTGKLANNRELLAGSHEDNHHINFLTINMWRNLADFPQNDLDYYIPSNSWLLHIHSGFRKGSGKVPDGFISTGGLMCQIWKLLKIGMKSSWWCLLLSG